MLTVRPGSHMYQLLRLLSITGEYPAQSLGVLGNIPVIKKMIHKKGAVQKIRLSDRTVLQTRLFLVSGKGAMRSIRLKKSAIPVLNELHPEALGYYLTSFPRNFTGNQYNIMRNHRVGEAVSLCMMAGAEVAPYILPKLQKDSIRKTVPDSPSFYVVRSLKCIYGAEMNKSIFTRIVGAMFYPGGVYAVYNTRNSIMKWNGRGEHRAKRELTEVVRMNANLDDTESALLLGYNINIALKTLLESDKETKNQPDRLDRVYNNVHFIPMTQNGVDMVRILTLPNWNEKLLNVIFKPEQRSKGFSSVEYDGQWEGRYVFSHLDSDIARLNRFYGALKLNTKERKDKGEEPLQFDVICYSWQIEFLKKYLGSLVRLRMCEMPKILDALRIERPVQKTGSGGAYE